MSGINYIIAIGVVAEEPKFIATKSGWALSFTLAVSEEVERPSEYIKCVKFQKSDRSFFNQGDTLSVEGSLTTEKWEDKKGKIQYSTKVRVKSMNKVN